MKEDEQKLKRRIEEVFATDEPNRIYGKAVREALLVHKRAGNPVPIERDGKMVWLQPDEIEVDW